MSEKNLTESLYTLGALLRKPYDHLAREVYGSIAEDGHPAIHAAHGSILRHIAPNGSRTVDLAKAAGMTKQSMAQLVADLESSGYVTLAPHPSDGRAKLVTLTEDGHRIQELIIAKSAEVEKKWSNAMGDERWSEVRGTLRDLFDYLEKNA